MDNRLASKRTVLCMSGIVMMGLAEDTTGFEQEGINSIDYFIIPLVVRDVPL